MQTKLQPGAEIMTQHGIFGTLISLDDEKNEAIIETTPGTRLRVHRQTVSRVIEPELEPIDDDIVDEADVETSVEADDTPSDSTEPEFGERTEKPKRAPRKKPTETE
jgi:preprotein translocase subunit YajC